MSDQQTPEERAEAAARDLADTGRAVTARAVREAAGVRMTVAATVAKAWNDAATEDTAVPVPDVPADVQGRLEAIWADAYRAALDAAAPERDRLQLELDHLTKDVQAYIADLQEAEQTETALRAEIDQANQRATKAEADADAAVEQAQHEAAETRGRAEQLAAENARLTTLIDEQLSKLTSRE
ncbi:MAG: DNA-binding protein [Micrococcaceae bacterium]|nr:DNA-binding protein [Micrococcaceae bacterium]